jgi:hypothetical protein
LFTLSCPAGIFAFLLPLQLDLELAATSRFRRPDGLDVGVGQQIPNR